MKLIKGERFKDYMGNLCFISYVKGDVVKLTFISDPSYTEVWDRQEFQSEIKSNRFFHQPQKKIDRTNITEHLIEYQLNMIGKTIDKASEVEDWHYQWTLTQKQYELFKAYSIPLLKKVFKFNKTKAENTFNWFYSNFGLRIN